MMKIRKDNEIIEINCDKEMCRDCSFKPFMSEQKCRLFDDMLDHVIGGFDNNSGWKRHSKCINAEAKE
jgi:hypothetical protein